VSICIIQCVIKTAKEVVIAPSSLIELIFIIMPIWNRSITMEILKVNHTNRTLEVLAKIMNSYATQYDCTVKYNSEYNSLDFRGENSHKHAIAYETSYILNAG